MRNFSDILGVAVVKHTCPTAKTETPSAPAESCAEILAKVNDHFCTFAGTADEKAKACCLIIVVP